MAPYPHFEHLPYAHEPWKSLYIAQRLFTTLALVPSWVIYYSIMPRSARPRRSWSIKQIVAVNFTRRVHKVTEMAGVTWGTRNPGEQPDPNTLKETRFEWVEPLQEAMRTGILDDPEVQFARVGTFVWPRVSSTIGMHRKRSTDQISLHEISKRDIPLETPDVVIVRTPPSPSPLPGAAANPVDIGTGSVDVPLVGIFMHGGGYCHMSAEEKCSTSRIPRRLMQDGSFTEIYSVEYRLLQFASFPGAVQDAAGVYAHVVSRYGKTADGRGCKIILLGDSSGGNLVLSLTRWIRDTSHLPLPDGLLLISPSCDPSHAFPLTPSTYIPRPHGATDYLVDTPEPRALLQRTFLGHHPMEMIHSPYVSPASERVLRSFYGDQEWEKIAKSVGIHINEYAQAHFDRLEAESRAEPEREKPVTPASSFLDITMQRNRPVLMPSYCHSDPDIQLLRRISGLNPKQLKLFEGFPRTCVILGDAERLESEILRLVGAMEHDGVKTKVIGAKDAVHDILMMRWWDETIREGVWKNIDDWVKMIAMY